jgi:multicomponent Na+:H+ antiporter subunit E
MKTLRWIELSAYLTKEILLAAIQVTGYAIFKGPRITPALMRLPLRVNSPKGIYLLSSMINLTPGNLCIEVGEDEMLVHVIHTTCPDKVVEEIQKGFEDRILVLLGGGK